jgi:minor extracellular serine protease Vpr
MKPSISAVLGSLILGAALTVPVSEAVSATSSAQRLALDAPRNATRLDPSLVGRKGQVEVVVQLSGLPLALVNGENARREGSKLGKAQQISHSQQIRRSQDELLAKVLALGGKEIGRVRIAYNAAIVRIDASKLQQLAGLPGVTAVQRVNEFQVDLSDTVPYIGAAAVQAAGVDGTGVRVAVLDSGIDYTHRNLGGAGTAAAYEAAWGTSTTDPRNTVADGFPTAKVIAGYDFVGEAWTGGAGSPPVAPDEDPIDHGGHGSHVADIIAGRSNDGEHVGVAPGASLVAVKVCSAITTSCNGGAILQGFDFALDPNGDGSTDDAVDVINLSLGLAYGMKEDATSAAAANAVKAGVVVVASAGNSGDKPYVVGSPSQAPGVISVAQTQVPSASAIPLKVNSPPAIAGTYGNTATLEWAPITSDVTGDVAYVGRGCVVDAYLADPAGKIALIDRGSCNISEKVRRASDAGAIGIIIGLIAPGDAVSFSTDDRCPLPPTGVCKPGIVITQALSTSIKNNLAAGVNVTFAESQPIPLIGGMASTSSRGPSYNFNAIKPDIGAPGASVSAEVGTGTGETPFSGTSGAAPMVSGAVALMLDAYPRRSPHEIKSVLMNTADTQVYINPATQPGVLAPITRIGGGEVQVDKAIASTTVAWDTEQKAGSLSFGYLNVSDSKTLVRKVRVQNYSRSARNYVISNAFRYDNDKTSGAVKISTPSNVFVPGNGSATFDVVMKIDAKKLPVWGLNGGALGGIGSTLQTVEYDGYLTLKDSRDTVRLAWQVLPHKSADLHVVNRNVVIPGKAFGLLAMANLGNALPGQFDIFNLTGTSPKLPKSAFPKDGEEFTVHDIAAVGVRQITPTIVQFAINTYGRRAHPVYPAEFDVYIDSDNDGDDDYVIYNLENTGFDTTGQTVIAAVNLATGAGFIRYTADADLDSGNMIMTVDMADVGLTAGQQFSFDVLAFDNYFTGSLTDAVENSVFTLGTPKYTWDDSNFPENGVPPRSGLLLKVDDVAGGAQASPSQTGFLMMYRDAAVEAETVTVHKIGK